MGMTTWTGDYPVKEETEIAKNYLNEKELDVLNRIVTMYLDYAELQALDRKPMHMRDWIAKLDDFLKFNERDILTHTGKVSHEMALQKAHAEYEQYRKEHLTEPTPVERQFMEAIKKLKQLVPPKKQRGKKKENTESNRAGSEADRDDEK